MPPCVSGLDGPIPSAPPGTASASTSPSSPSTRRRSSSACSTRRPTTREAHRIRAARADRPRLARLPARRAARPALRLPRPRPVRRRRPGTASIRTRSLLDPYAKAIGRPLALGRRDLRLHARADTATISSRDDRDNAAVAPLGVVIDPAFTWGDDRPPRTPWHETVIYELHVKGFTRLHPGVPEPLRGTYLGLASRRRRSSTCTNLGVTAVELLPVHHHADDRHLVERGPDELLGLQHARATSRPTSRFAAPGGRMAAVREFKTMVRALHAAGLEVILDVVYNHTAEGDQLGPDALAARHRQRVATTASRPATRAATMDFTGCGNTLNMRHPRVLQLIMDSLRYWVVEMHVDGFRFDLASALARELYEVDKLGVVLRHHPAGPGALAGQADRRAVGPRARAATRWATSPSAGRSGTASTATACAASGGATAGRCRELATALAGSSDLYAHERPAPVRQHQLRHLPRRLHAARPRQLRQQAQRGQRRGQPRRRRRQPQLELRRRRRRPTTRPSSRCARGRSATSWPRCCSRRACRCSPPATSSAARSAATTTPTARTTRSAGSTGISTPDRHDLLAFTRRLIHLRAGASRAAAADVLPGQRHPRRGHHRHPLARARTARR